MQKNLKYALWLIVILALPAGLFLLRSQNKLAQTPLPPAKTYNDPAPAVKNPPPKEPLVSAPEKPRLPAEVNLKIPFTSQAPHQKWDLPHKEFCEEASALMVYSYLKNQSILSADDADAKMLAIRDFEMKRFGYYEDTNAEETAAILKEFYGLEKVKVVANPSALDIKTALVESNAVILPLAGQQIGNPFYHQPGPLYHMLVVKGYTKDGHFITNDPGTRRGADFLYPEGALMNALSDWDHATNDIAPEKKVIIIVG